MELFQQFIWFGSVTRPQMWSQVDQRQNYDFIDGDYEGIHKGDDNDDGEYKGITLGSGNMLPDL